jgi:hypothetical protein
MTEQTIKEKMSILNDQFSVYVNSIVDNPQAHTPPTRYYIDNILPDVLQLTFECEQIGHINLETITREDGTQYYSCDECSKQIELNN